jgi:GH24 family phage-related lysozyme (muramidase)
MDQRLIADVNGAEGRRLTAYRDTLGYWTAGVGHKLDPSQDWTNVTFTAAQSDSWLEADLEADRQEATALPEWYSLDTSCRQNAVIEAVFNLGIGHWTTEFPHTRDAIMAHDWTGAYKGILASPEWIVTVGLARVTRLATYLLTGEYP